jgi:stage III sporulation protein AB
MAERMGHGEISQMMHLATRGMRERNGGAFREIWQEAVRKALGSGVLEQQELEVIAESWMSFCNPDVVLQKTMFDQQIARMELQKQNAQQQYLEKAGLYRRLGAIGGAFLIILLL